MLPHLKPPTSTAYEEDRDALNAQFDVAEALLKEIQAETAAVKAAVDEQKDRIDQTTSEVKAVVQEMREGETKTRDEMREIREEVNHIREMLPKVCSLIFFTFSLLNTAQMIDKNKESQNQSLAELQQELKSLKALLLNRAPTLPPSTSSSTLPLLSRPSIPAWQLASSPNSADIISSSTTTPSTIVASPTTSYPLGGKGKEVDKPSESSSTS